MKHPQDDAIAEMLKGDGFNENGSMRNKSKIDPNLNNYPSVTIKKQFARNNPKSNYLPVHMQNLNGRIAMNNNTYNSLKANNFKDRPFLDPISTLNTRKDFHFTAL